MSFGDDAAILRRFEQSAVGQFIVEEGVGFKILSRNDGVVVVVNAARDVARKPLSY